MINLRDISKIDIESLPTNIDMITHGSPCQSYSISGKQEGGDKGSGTQSSLMWYTVEIVKHCKPRYVIWENVKNVLSKKHKHNFEQYVKDLEDLGYTNYYKVLNAKNFGIPQNRERIYCISILGEHNPYEFPKEFELKWRLKDLLQDSVESKYYLSEKIQNRFKQIKEIKEENNVIGTTKPEFRTIGQRDLVYNKDGIMGTLNATDYKQPKQILEVDEKYYINKSWHFTRPDEQKHDMNEIAQVDNVNYKTLRSITDPNKLCRCLDTMGGGQREPKILTKNYKIRKITPLECWRLMGFDDEDFYKAKNVPTSDTQLYKQAGNSIVVNVLEEIFKKLLY